MASAPHRRRRPARHRPALRPGQAQGAPGKVRCGRAGRQGRPFGAGRRPGREDRRGTVQRVGRNDGGHQAHLVVDGKELRALHGRSHRAARADRGVQIGGGVPEDPAADGAQGMVRARRSAGRHHDGRPPPDARRAGLSRAVHAVRRRGQVLHPGRREDAVPRLVLGRFPLRALGAADKEARLELVLLLRHLQHRLPRVLLGARPAPDRPAARAAVLARLRGAVLLPRHHLPPLPLPADGCLRQRPRPLLAQAEPVRPHRHGIGRAQVRRGGGLDRLVVFVRRREGLRAVRAAVSAGRGVGGGEAAARRVVRDCETEERGELQDGGAVRLRDALVDPKGRVRESRVVHGQRLPGPDDPRGARGGHDRRAAGEDRERGGFRARVQRGGAGRRGMLRRAEGKVVGRFYEVKRWEAPTRRPVVHRSRLLFLKSTLCS